jgi:4-hydroxymandelate oxidase
MSANEEALPTEKPLDRRALFTAAAAAAAGAAAATGFAGAAFAQARPDRIDPGQPGGPPLPAMSRTGFPVVPIPTYGQALMDVINTHEFEPIAKKSISTYAYDYIRAGAGDDLTLQANLAAYDDFWIRRRIMVDVSHVDTSIQMFGERWEHPIMLGPVGLRRLLHPDGDRLTILAAHQSKAVLMGPRLDLVPEITKQGMMPKWWGFALGHKTKQEARDWAKKNEDLGASAICIGMDYPYTGLRDIPSRDHWEGQWDNKPEFNDGDGTVTFQAAMIWPYFPNMNWEWFDWIKGATKLPIVAKGITTGEDAKKALAGGVSAIVVSNHGGRTLDGANPTLRALPEVVDAVGGKVPVISDGGIRRGGDIIKAMALGAHAVTIGRPYLWALAGFGQEGVQRCIEMLQGELRIALGLSGTAVPSAIDRTLIREAWKPYTPHKPTHA